MDRVQMLKRVDEALNQIRPHLRVDGGDVEVVDITEDLRVKVRWVGNCATCDMSVMTMRAGVEQAIRMQVPEVHSIEAINGITSAMM